MNTTSRRKFMAVTAHELSVGVVASGHLWEKMIVYEALDV